MVTPGRCPVCGSDAVYCLLDTLHCKRCQNIWTEEKKRSKYDVRDVETPVSNQTRAYAIKESPDKRMEKQLENYLKKYQGKFTTYTIASAIGDIQMAMFRRYLKKCVRNRTLVEEKDQYGRYWYSRPE
jgi:response regulator of citrate/malate metabolism